MPESLLRRLGLRLLPLLHPTRDEDRRDRDRVTAAIAAQGEHLRRYQEQLTELRRDVRQVQECIGEARADVAGGFARQRERLDRSATDTAVAQRDHTRRLQTTIARHSAFVKGVLRNARHISAHAVEQEGVLHRLARIAASGRTIVVGPWTGEVGFELVYWVPFVRWFVEYFAVDPARLIIMSRGGPVSWYGELAGRYVDVLEFLEGSDLVDVGRTRKQRHAGPRDRRLIRHVARRVGGPVSVLHPSYLYGMCGAYFDGYAGVRPVFEFLRHRRIVPPAVAFQPGLPDDYVAAKFYFSAAFPDTASNRAFIADLLERISRRCPVVLLEHGVAVDDHRSFSDRRYADLASIGAGLTAANNLEVQTAVVSRARAFVGTYGGFSYLAPLCGVEAIAFHSEDEFYLHHRHLADEAFARLHVPALTVLPARAARLLDGVVERATAPALPRA